MKKYKNKIVLQNGSVITISKSNPKNDLIGKSKNLLIWYFSDDV